MGKSLLKQASPWVEAFKSSVYKVPCKIVFSNIYGKIYLLGYLRKSEYIGF